MPNQDDNQVDEIQKKIKEQEELNEKAQKAEEMEMANQNEKDIQIQELTIVAKQAMADLSNYRKRVEDEKKSFAQFANAGLILEFLSVVDAFDRATSAIPTRASANTLPDSDNSYFTSINEWITGIQSIDQQFHAILEKQGVKPIKSVGEKLDPTRHEALLQGAGEKDMILEEFEKGYLLGDRILRPAKVKVGNGEGVL